MLAGGAALLAACDRGEPAPAGFVDPLDAAVAGAWRPASDRARDAWRHPAETLRFFGLQPAQTVAEFWPGAGWYTAILAPYLKVAGGRLIAVQVDPAAGGADAELVGRFRERFSNARVFGRPMIAAFGPETPPPAPADSVDLVLFLRNLHNWMSAGLAEKAFADAHVILRAGGVLGVEQHRAALDAPQDPLAASGYVQQAYVRRLAEEAGFAFDGASEINANPADNREHPFGVWTLPPVRRASLPGTPPDPAFDHAPYEAIGESDRMTLRFRKA